MLVLARKKNERIIINGNIVITLLDVRRDGSVRIGIEAPREILVHREEIVRRIEREKAEGRER